MSKGKYDCLCCVVLLSLGFVNQSYADGGMPQQMQMVIFQGKNKTRVVEVKRMKIRGIAGPMDMVIFDTHVATQPVLTGLKDEKDTLLPFKNTKVSLDDEFVSEPIKEFESAFTISTGYRRDSLDWSIGSVGGPNILSELQWDDLGSALFEASYTVLHKSNLYGRFDLGIGYTIDGDVQDSDYGGDNKTFEFSRSYSDADGSNLFDVSLGLGYRFEIDIDNAQFGITPMIGYSFNQQSMKMTDGVQVVSEYGFGMPLGPFSGLDSSYAATWNGPWIGLDVDLDFAENHRINIGLEYHWVDYEGQANWNLRESFAHPVSFEHKADGEGYAFKLGYSYDLTDDVSVIGQVKYQKMETDSGIYTAYFADSSKGTYPFNGAIWESAAVSIGIVYSF